MRICIRLYELHFFIFNPIPGSHNGKSRNLILSNRANITPVSFNEIWNSEMNNEENTTIQFFHLQSYSWVTRQEIEKSDMLQSCRHPPSYHSMKFRDRRFDITVFLFQQFESFRLSGKSWGVGLHFDIQLGSMLTMFTHRITDEAMKNFTYEI